MPFDSGQNVIGGFISTYRDCDKVEQYDLRCCGHCGYTWRVMKGSGKLRGWCGLHGHLCGHAECVKAGCISWQREIDNMEAGRPWGYRDRVAVNVPCNVPTSPGGILLVG